MYAKNIAQLAARQDALNIKGYWLHLAKFVSKGPEEYARAMKMVELWSFVVAELNHRIRPISGPDLLPTIAGVIFVADALVVRKSEIAYKVDHLMPGGTIHG